MAIDPLLYEKISGRSADPSKRLGEALAQSNRQSANTRASKEAPNTMGTGLWRFGLLGLEVRWWMSIVGSIIVLIVLISAFAHR